MIRSAPAKPPSARRRLPIAKLQVGHDRRGRPVEVVAVERQPGLEPKRIARAEADRLDPLVGDQRVGERLDARPATEISNPSSPV